MFVGPVDLPEAVAFGERAKECEKGEFSVFAVGEYDDENEKGGQA